MPALFDQDLVKTLEEDKLFLETTALPIITVSATFREDVKRLHQLPNNNIDRDTVFSRAHYSMALGVAIQAWGETINPKKAWLVDPTNYVSHEDWMSVAMTEKIGQQIARHPLLKLLKDLVDKFARKKLPILDSITPPLLYLSQKIDRPILSFHIAAGNILAMKGKKVFQMITDPHVREEYVTHAGKPNVRFAVFDDQTRFEFLELASLHGKEVLPDQVVVTGPPIDPRIVAARQKKYAWRSGPLRLCITTGGLGTNKNEIRTMLLKLLPQLRKRDVQYQVLIYTATHADIAQMVTELAEEFHVPIEDIHDKSARLRMIYHPQILDANELLIRHGFPWAHGFITKPSGDMAYDAVASGAFILTMAEWGEWEENVRKVFEQEGVCRKALPEKIIEQLEFLTSAKGKSQSWVEAAMLNAAHINKLYLNGSKKIVEAYKEFAEE
jgi:hypothetical protein